MLARFHFKEFDKSKIAMKESFCVHFLEKMVLKHLPKISKQAIKSITGQGYLTSVDIQSGRLKLTFVLNCK